MTKNKNTHGGKRKGAGAKKKSPEQKKEETVVMRVRKSIVGQVRAMNAGAAMENILLFCFILFELVKK